MDLVSTPKNPIPLGVSSGHIEVRKGLRLRFASWQPVLRERRGTVCIFPGRAEFIEKYFEVVGELRRRGFAVAVLDWRGQGGSSRLTRNPLKGHINDFAEYEEDLSHFILRFSRCGRAFYKSGPSESQLLDHGNQILKTSGFESCRQGLLVQSFAFEFGLSHLERQFADFLRGHETEVADMRDARALGLRQLEAAMVHDLQVAFRRAVDFSADLQRTGLDRGEKSERRAEKDPGFRGHRSTTRVRSRIAAPRIPSRGATAGAGLSRASPRPSSGGRARGAGRSGGGRAPGG